MNQPSTPQKTHSFSLLSTLVGLTALSTLNPLTAEAASLACGPGNNWVQSCQSGVYHFSNSVTIGVNFGFSPNNLPDFVAKLKGQTSIVISDPVDAIVDDPLLGNVGTVDGNNDVIKAEFFNSVSSGPTPFVPFITAAAGDGVPDLMPTPNEPGAPPFTSLYSAGAIVQDANDPTLADSFFSLFLEIQGTPEGTIRTRDPLLLSATAPLTGFPPGTGQTLVDYVNTAITPLFSAGDDGEFWTGDEVEVARLVPDFDGNAVTLSLDVPEPSTILFSLLAALGMIVKKKIA